MEGCYHIDNKRTLLNNSCVKEEIIIEILKLKSASNFETPRRGRGGGGRKKKETPRRDLFGSPMTMTSHFHCEFQSLVEELRSCMLDGVAKNK